MSLTRPCSARAPLSLTPRPEGPSFAELTSGIDETAVDERLVEMCKKELLNVDEVRLLPKRCRNTLLKHLARSKREESAKKSQDGRR